MTFVVDGTNGLTFPNSTTQASAGKVLQVVNTILSTYTSTSSSSPVTTGLSISITPTSATSKILSTTSLNGCNCSNNNAFRFDIFRNGSSIIQLDDIFGYLAQGGNMSWGSQYLDSPATTSATTYALYFYSQTGASAVYFNNYYGASGRTKSLFTAMEIAA